MPTLPLPTPTSAPRVRGRSRTLRSGAAATPGATGAGSTPDEPGGADRPRVFTFDLSLGAPLLDAPAVVRELVERAGAELGLTGEVRVRIVCDAEMALAHFTHCGVEGTTDVITMDLRDPPGAAARDGVIDADLLVCADEARRQSAARGIPVAHEIVLYVLHGVLHCMGFDDHDEAGYAAMHAREDAVLRAIGIGPVFARHAGGEGSA